jgi:uncharacterized protein (DUF2342 family)
MPSPVDYDLAVATARRLAPAPPQVSWEEAGAIVGELRGLAVRAEEHVRAVTGMVPPGDVLEATVVDRPGWAAANVEGFRVVLEPLTKKLERRPPRPGSRRHREGHRRADGLRARLAVEQVLGQYEAFTAAGTPGRLIMVAPNIVETERRLEVDPARLPAVGRAARGHPPHAVHRGPWLARPRAERDHELLEPRRWTTRRSSWSG